MRRSHGTKPHTRAITSQLRNRRMLMTLMTRKLRVVTKSETTADFSVKREEKALHESGVVERWFTDLERFHITYKLNGSVEWQTVWPNGMHSTRSTPMVRTEFQCTSRQWTPKEHTPKNTAKAPKERTTTNLCSLCVDWSKESGGIEWFRRGCRRMTSCVLYSLGLGSQSRLSVSALSLRS